MYGLMNLLKLIHNVYMQKLIKLFYNKDKMKY